MEDFRDPQTAASWSADPLLHNPLRAEQLDILLSILQAEYKQGDTIIDVGIGSGIVEEELFRLIPSAQVLGIDFSEAMVELAHTRLRDFREQYSITMHDLRDIGNLQLPQAKYSLAFSIQTIHNVEDTYKRDTFAFVHRVLAPDGLFLLLDRIAIDTPGLFDVYKLLWTRLNRLHHTTMFEGHTFEEHTQGVHERGDLPATLEQHLQWLSKAGFEVACLHLHGNRALFAAHNA